MVSQGGAEPRWGEDTTDESEGEVAHYSGRRREILDSAVTVFADAAEEFASLPALKARLEAWKASHASAPSLFSEAPLSRLFSTHHLTIVHHAVGEQLCMPGMLKVKS